MPRPGRSTAVRSPAGERARRRGGRRRRRGSLLHCSALLALGSPLGARCAEKKERGEEREEGGANEIGFQESGGGRRFCSPENHEQPSDLIQRCRLIGPLSAQAGEGVRPLSRPRPRLRPGRGGERGKRPRGRGPWAALPFSVDTGKARAQFQFFLFPGKLKIQIGSKEK